jgi:hypothetical protein
MSFIDGSATLVTTNNLYGKTGLLPNSTHTSSWSMS